MKNLLLFLFTVTLSFLSIGMSIEIEEDLSLKRSDIVFNEKGIIPVVSIVKEKERIHHFRNVLIDNNIAYKKMLSTKTLSKNKQFNNIIFFSQHNLE